MRPFPLLVTVRAAYANVLGSADTLVRAGGAWLLLLMVLAGASRLLLVGIAPDEATGRVQLPNSVLLLSLAGNIVWAFSLNAIAVFWHRHVLLEEAPPEVAAPLNRRVMHYVAVSLFLGLLVAVPFLLLVFVATTLMAGPTGQFDIGIEPAIYRLLFSLSIALVIARIHLVLPAIAIGDRTMTLGRAWKLTAGYTAPLLAGIFASALPLTLLGALIQELLAAIGGAGTLTGLAIATVTDFIQAAIVAAFMSISYRFFTTHIAARESDG
jgi:hypothetical protein